MAFPAAVVSLPSLSDLPERRRARVLETWRREAAAERVREVYPLKLALYVTERAQEETAAEVNAALALPAEPGGFAVSCRWVQRVMREGR